MFVKKSAAAALLLSCALVPATVLADNSAYVDMFTQDCAILDADGNIVSVMESAQIVSSAQAGEHKLRCAGDVPPPSSGRAEKSSDFLCQMAIQAEPGDDSADQLVLTNDTELRISASGKAVLRCYFSE